jgi:hypothetical protein
MEAGSDSSIASGSSGTRFTVAALLRTTRLPILARRDKVAWDEELKEDFAPGGKHEKALEEIDTEIDSGNFTPLP